MALYPHCLSLPRSINGYLPARFTCVLWARHFIHTVGDDNVAIGTQALYYNTTGKNVAIGSQALQDNVVGDSNTAIGWQALALNTASSNTAIGYQAHYGNPSVSGSSNVAIGYEALHNNGGDNNTAIGYQAGTGLFAGNNNIFIGKSAQPWATPGTNQIVIGCNTTGIGDHMVALGDTNMTRIAGQVLFTTYSDSRIKKNITDNDLGLDFINKLRPIKYQ